MVRVLGRELFVVYFPLRALPSLQFRINKQMVPPILFAHRARLPERQTQWKKNHISDTLLKKNFIGKVAALLGWQSSWAAPGRMPTRFSTANGFTPICYSKSAIFWIMISSSAFRNGAKQGKIINSYENFTCSPNNSYFCRPNFSTLIH